MKVYHGTSFESACNILQSEYWEDSFGDFVEDCIKFSTKQSQKTVKELHERFELLKGIHFTTSLSHAMSYACKKKHPVILEMDYPPPG